MNRWFDRIPIISELFSGKIVLSFLMLLLSMVLFMVFKTSDRMVCMIGMFFAFLGDITLNYKKPFRRDKSDLLLGGLLFIVAHLIYAIAYGIKIFENNYNFFNAGTIFFIGVLGAITILIVIKTRKSGNKYSLCFGLPYLWLTGINYITISTYSISAKSIESLALVGGILFLASDVIIGFEEFFGLRSKVARELVWWLYPIGQMLIIIMA